MFAGDRILAHSPSYVKVTIGLRLQLDGEQITKEAEMDKEERVSHGIHKG